MTGCKFKVAAVPALILLGACAAFGQRANAVPILLAPTRTRKPEGDNDCSILCGNSDWSRRTSKESSAANAVAASDNVSSLRYVRLTDVDGPRGKAS